MTSVIAIMWMDISCHLFCIVEGLPALTIANMIPLLVVLTLSVGHLLV